jgi:Na+/proline symporter
MGLLLAAKLRRGQYVTLADYYRERYGSFIEKFAIIILVPTTLLGAAAQLRAFGQVAAGAALAVGFALTILGEYMLHFQAPFITSVLGSALAFIALATLEKQFYE